MKFLSNEWFDKTIERAKDRFKPGKLALTFCDPSSYDSVREDDLIDVRCAGIQPGSRIEVLLHHSDGTTESFLASHTYNRQQLEWFSAGSALNSLNL